MAKKLEDYVISIPDFPEPGIIFRDITSIIGNADGLKLAVDELQAAVVDCDYEAVAKLCRKAADVLAERNRLCKLNKN